MVAFLSSLYPGHWVGGWFIIRSHVHICNPPEILDMVWVMLCFLYMCELRVGGRGIWSLGSEKSGLWGPSAFHQHSIKAPSLGSVPPFLLENFLSSTMESMCVGSKLTRSMFPDSRNWLQDTP